MPQRVAQARAEGATFVIAHPKAWATRTARAATELPGHDAGNARIVEVWNSAWDSNRNNEQSLQLWYDWLNRGYRMVGTRGTDIHGPLEYTNVGFNIVYADELSEAAILSAIRQGHLYISAQPTLNLQAHGDDGGVGVVGDLLGGQTVRVTLTWENVSAGDHLRWLVNGAIVEEVPIEAAGTREWTLNAADARWAVVEIRGANGEVHALTNPVFGFVSGVE